ncbi:CPBP family intramembrane metalloprotease [Corynebacterium felinum]|uniref:Membrane protease YdiL (CAAX protease family) n=1 Tax=Corynebacterium felinum TaxID=131318 RepID=A0ABU2B635_9CORY|nr:CPBP family intramembrane glutamic endopeptidase [Corynebacterium felinum]MDF5820807.1 CPBP family intramembrane metalloprotease [Corynebacterium felinum]MDR7354077.1 membrane protease YdiL (CAAX protease family) [Corynebacterium felinum]WJY96249.1 CAAX amino terminal protease self- immunity [Corynebacterium felinum]
MQSVVRSRLVAELCIVLVITFGVSGLRAGLRLVNAVLSPQPLGSQTVTLNAQQSPHALIDIGLQLCSAAVLFGWGFLALFLLQTPIFQMSAREFRRWCVQGLGLAALIGVPGLGLYLASVALDLSKQVVPASFDQAWWEIPVLLLWSSANAFAEEVVVVMWLLLRLRQLGVHAGWAVAASAVLRGSYHLYQGFSAGVGNVVMGVVFAYFFHRTGKIWPLILAHFFIDAVAFVGSSVLGSQLHTLLGF